MRRATRCERTQRRCALRSLWPVDATGANRYASRRSKSELCDPGERCRCDSDLTTPWLRTSLERLRRRRVFSPPPRTKRARGEEYGGLVRPQGSVGGGLTRRMQGAPRHSSAASAYGFYVAAQHLCTKPMSMRAGIYKNALAGAPHKASVQDLVKLVERREELGRHLLVRPVGRVDALELLFLVC